MNLNQRRRLEKLEQAIAPPSAPPVYTFAIIDLGDWPDAARADFDAAATREDWDACNRLMAQFGGVPLPSPMSRRRSGRPRRVVELVIDHLAADFEPDDEPDSRERTLSDGSTVIVTSPAPTPAQSGYQAFAPDGRHV